MIIENPKFLILQKSVFLISLFFLFFSCGEEEKCLYKPEPIFKKEWKKVTAHSFEKNGKKATEKVTFENKMRLELFQTVCNNSQQEYHFIIQGDFKDQTDEYWVTQAVNAFYYMSSAGEEVRPIAGWGQRIQSEPENFPLGEIIEIENGISIKIDRLISPGEAQIIIIIAQGEKEN